MFMQSNKILAVMLLLTFIFVPYVGQTNSGETEGIIKEVCASIRNVIKDMSPNVMLGTLIAVILFVVILRSFIVFVFIFGMLFMVFDNPKEIIDCVREKFNLVVNNIGLKDKIVVDISGYDKKESTNEEMIRNNKTIK
jgi:quinol-cytochrome oxidoreductase complex cytochrome b subunit